MMLDFASLRAAVSGPVLTPADPGFSEEVTGWLLNYSHTPDVVVGVASVEDAAAAVAFAHANDLPVRVQATGHGADTPITDGMLITTKRLDSVEIDTRTRLATIGAGLAWASVVAAAAPLGLAPITGSSGTVGAVGFLLGGGLGPLARSHGFGSDWVREFQVVTGGGEIELASADENSDLFWALRGGKGGLGVVTRVTVELAPLASIYGGSLTFDAPDIDAALRAWIDYTATADPRVSTSAAIMRVPDFPFIPEAVRGRTLLALRFAYPGDAATGEKLAAPLRSAAPVYIDALAELPVGQLDTIHADPPNPAMGWVRARTLNGLDANLASTMLNFAGADKQIPFVSVEIRHLGAATQTDVPGGSAVSGRNAKATLTLVGAPNPELFETVVPRAAASFWEAAASWIDAQNNINFASPFDSKSAYESIWPAEYFARLATIRRKYDPKGVFIYGL
jgi:FAD/FMN-containing dehydrogenase